MLSCLNFFRFIYTKTATFFYRIYRKPTTTDLTHNHITLTPFSALVRRLLNVCCINASRLNQEEVDTIKCTAIRNGYKSNLIDNLIQKQRRKSNGVKTDKDNRQFNILIVIKKALKIKY